MPNIVAPTGLKPVRYLDGSPWTGATNMYYIPSTDVAAYYPGDAVKVVAGSDPNGIPNVIKAAGADTLRGVVVGVLVAAPNNPSLLGTSLDLTNQYIPAAKTKGYYVLVCDDQNVVYEIQDDGLAALPATSVGKNASMTIVAPSASAQNSATVLATASVATSAALNLKILGLAQRPNVAFGVNATWLVKINQHDLQGNIAGV